MDLCAYVYMCVAFVSRQLNTRIIRENDDIDKRQETQKLNIFDVDLHARTTIQWNVRNC